MGEDENRTRKRIRALRDDPFSYDAIAVPGTVAQLTDICLHVSVVARANYKGPLIF